MTRTNNEFETEIQSARRRPSRCFALFAGCLLALAALAPAVQAGPPLTQAEREQETQKLVATLQSPTASQYDKIQACHRLAIVGTKEAVPILASLLTDEKLAHMARYALEPMLDSAVDDAFRAALGKLNGKLLIGVINSIGVRRDAKAIGDLTKLLSVSEPDVAAAAAESLGRIGNAKCAKALESALAQASATARPAMAEACLICAERLLAQKESRNATALYDALLKTDLPGHVRMAAMRGAILVRGKAGIPLLVEQLRSADVPMNAVAYRVAREMPGSEVTRALVAELPGLPAEKQVLLLQALGDRGDAAALPAVLTSAKSGPTRVRVEALRTLAKLGDASAVPLLLATTGDPEKEVAQSAQACLAMLPGKGVDAALIAAVSGGEAGLRRGAIEAVAQRRLAGAAPALFKAAGDADPAVRLAALKALGDTVGADEFSSLADVLVKAQSADELAAAQAALQSACTRLPEKAACSDALVARLPQAPAKARCAILELLGDTGGTAALAAVRTATGDANAEVKDAAVRALAAWPDATAAPELLAIARNADSESHRALAFGGVTRLIREADAPANQKLQLATDAAPLAKDAQDKKLLLSALGEIKQVAALRLAAQYLSDPALADEAGAAVVKITAGLGAGEKAEVAPVLRQVLESSKAKPVLDGARKQMTRLGISAQ